MRIGILTGGGDCPGLNSVIYGVLLQAFESGHDVIGIEKGWKGFLENLTKPLKIAELEDLHTVGGTILYTSRTNPFKKIFKVENPIEREETMKKLAEEFEKKFTTLGIDVLIVIGGDDTLGAASAIHRHTGAKMIGVPKTIDNDLSGTDYTFGFWSAVQLASNSLDNLTTTARSHQRIFVVEVMGRDAGWLTAMSGISAGAAIILLPEIPFDFETDIVKVLKERIDTKHDYHIVACAEGAVPTEKSLNRDFKFITKETIDNLPKDVFGNPLLAKLNMSKIIVKELNSRNDLKKHFNDKGFEYEVRSVILGHTMRAGTPNSFDRVQGLRLGMHAAKLIDSSVFGKMVIIKGDRIENIPLSEGSKKKLIDPASDIVKLRDLLVKVKHQSKKN
ncbi:MAG: 6-phosphofructokinase [Candidatus Hodarchaeales archaeon]|jgi:6-phosphofructokinase 1